MLYQNLDNIGPGFIDNAEGATAPNLPTNISAIRSFVRACTARPMSDEDWETTLCFNIVVPPQVRRAMIFSRQIDSDDVRSEVRVPVLIAHGDRDIDGSTTISQHVLDSAQPPKHPGTTA